MRKLIEAIFSFVAPRRPPSRAGKPYPDLLAKHALKVGAVMAASGWWWMPAFGGTVITTNLPANTAIINISGTQDGAAGYNGDKSLWYHPFFTGGATQLLEYTFQPGTYAFRIVDPADAAQLFPALNPAQTNQIFTAWTFNSPWITSYVAFDSAAATNTSLPQLFDGASGTNSGNAGVPLFGSASAAYDAAVSNGFYRLIRAGTNGYDSTNFMTSYTFRNAETLIFAAPDNALGDNAGGVSVLISPTNLAPILNIIGGGETVSLQWLTNATGYTLAQTTNLQPAAWSDVTNVPVIVSSNYSVTLPRDPTASRFFRLHNP